MNRARLPWLLLAVSLVLNIAFLGGFAWMHLHRPHGPGDFAQRAERAGRELRLDDAQKAAFDRFLAVQRDNNEAVRDKWQRKLR